MLDDGEQTQYYDSDGESTGSPTRGDPSLEVYTLEQMLRKRNSEVMMRNMRLTQ